MEKTFQQIEKQPCLLENSDFRRLLSSQIIHMAVKMLTVTLERSEPLTTLADRRRRGVRRVIDYLKAHARELATIPELCAVAQTCERSLEYGFREQLGVTPIRYQNLVRLNGARKDLQNSDGATTRVADIALRWGFVELGRFSGVYARLFNELPSQTLRRG